MDDDELNATLAFEESCLQLPLSQGALFMDADVVDVPGEPGAPVTPPHSSVGFFQFTRHWFLDNLATQCSDRACCITCGSTSSGKEKSRARV